jgi:hypothetical protein
MLQIPNILRAESAAPSNAPVHKRKTNSAMRFTRDPSSFFRWRLIATDLAGGLAQMLASGQNQILQCATRAAGFQRVYQCGDLISTLE